MPNRIIKETITTSDTLAQLTAEAERHFYRLIVQADDHGRFDARPHVIRSRAYSAMLDRVLPEESERLTISLEAAELIKLYEVDGKRYGAFVTWEQHQRVRAAVSKFPAPSLASADTRGHLTAVDGNRGHPPQSATNVAVFGVGVGVGVGDGDEKQEKKKKASGDEDEDAREDARASPASAPAWAKPFQGLPGPGKEPELRADTIRAAVRVGESPTYARLDLELEALGFADFWRASHGRYKAFVDCWRNSLNRSLKRTDTNGLPAPPTPSYDVSTEEGIQAGHEAERRRQILASGG